MRLALYSLLLPALLLGADDSTILSGEKQLQLRLKSEKNKEEASKLQDSWINPLTLSATQTKNSVDTDFESTSTSYRLTLSQDIFRSGGIYYAVQYADAMEKLQASLLKLEEKALLSSAYQTLLLIKRATLGIEKQKKAIESAEIDVKYKQEQYLNGLTDISFLNNAVLTKNRQKSALSDLQNAKADLIQQFSNLSDLPPETVEAIEFQPISEETFLQRNLALEQKKHEIESKRYVKNMTITSYLPKLTVDASYVSDHTESPYSFQQRDESYYNYGLKLSIPLSINTYRDIESARLDYLISRSELTTGELEEANFYKSIQKRLDAIKTKISLAQEDFDLYEKLLFQTVEQKNAGLKTADDVAVMKNSRDSSRLDIEIYRIDRQLELLKLYAKTAS